MNPHLICIPRLGSLTTRRLPRRNLEMLRRETHGAFNTEVLRLGAVNELAADFLEGLDVTRGQGNADLVDFL